LPEQIALRGERVDQAAGVSDDQHHRRGNAQRFNLRRLSIEAAVQREIEHRRHDQRHHGEEQHHCGVARGGTVEGLASPPEPADEEAQAEHQQQVADDAPGDRGLDQLDVPFVQRDDRDDQLRGVAEGGVQEPTKGRPRLARQLLGADADDAGERHQRQRGQHEHPGRAATGPRQHPRGRCGDQQQVEAV
jgi:hypothetical protein